MDTITFSNKHAIGLFNFNTYQHSCCRRKSPRFNHSLNYFTLAKLLRNKLRLKVYILYRAARY